MSKLAALQQRHESTSFGLADLSADALYAQGIICSRAKKVDGKTKAIAFDTRSDEFLLNADGSFLLFKDWKQANGIGRKSRADKGSRLIKQPGDVIDVTKADVRQYLAGNPVRRKKGIPVDDPFVRVNSSVLADVEHEIPDSVRGENALRSALRGFLRCRDEDMERIARGFGKLADLREFELRTLSPERFQQRWVIGEQVEVETEFGTVVAQHDKTGPALVRKLPELTAKPFVPKELEQCDRPAYIPLPLDEGQSWRPGQMDVAAAVFSGSSTLAVLPTGYGKTLAFTYPLIYEANMLGARKLTVIVTPTNTLKQQLADELASLNAVFFGNGISGIPLEQRLAGVLAGAFGVVIVSPEHLVPGSQVLAALIASEKVERIVFDEAHCVSTWEFRSAYAEAAETLRHAFPGVQRCAFTATLPKGQEAELMRTLGSSEFLTFRGSAARENIQLDTVQHVQEELGAVRQLVDQLEGKTLVLVNSARTAERLSAVLGAKAKPFYTGASPLTKKRNKQQGKKSSRYHMTLNQRHEAAEWFRCTDDVVLIATKAFGLGIDIPDIQNVIVSYVPEDLSEVTQMIGRAGRNGQPARAVLLWSRKALDTAPDEVAALYRPENTNWQYICQFM